MAFRFGPRDVSVAKVFTGAASASAFTHAVVTVFHRSSWAHSFVLQPLQCQQPPRTTVARDSAVLGEGHFLLSQSYPKHLWSLNCEVFKVYPEKKSGAEQR